MADTGPALTTDFFAADTLEVARALIGATLSFGGCSGVVVEVEAYKGDPASHYVTRRLTGAIMGETFGRVYVYRIYGMHACLNFTTDSQGPGAVLLRALQPIEGLEVMRERRGVERDRLLCSGPARLVEALGVPVSLTGQLVTDHFTVHAPAAAVDVATGPRIGISQATDLPWRFVLRGSPWLSRREPAVPTRGRGSAGGRRRDRR